MIRSAPQAAISRTRLRQSQGPSTMLLGRPGPGGHSLLSVAWQRSGPRKSACPPVVEYSREFQARAAEELELLPEGSAIAEMMSDYAVLREQARVC